MYAIYVDEQLLYEADLTDIGYGLLDIRLTTELNKAGCLEFTVPFSNVMYDKLQKLKAIVSVREDGTEIWRGRILHEEKDFNNSKRIYCEGQLAFLMDAIQRPYTFSGSPAQLFSKLITTYNDQVELDRRFKLSSITVTDPNDYIIRSNSDYVPVYNELMDKLVSNLGGYVFIKKAPNYYYIQYLSDPGKISDQIIRFGSNLLDITEYVNAENIFTVLIPLGATMDTDDGEQSKRLTIEDVNDGKDYIESECGIEVFGKIWRTNVWDDVTNAGNLLQRAKTYLEQNISMSVTLEIKAVDLHLIDVDTETIKLGDYIRVISEPHSLDEYFLCTKIVTDLLNPANTEFTLGTSLSAMTDEQLRIQKSSQNAIRKAQSAESSASNASSVVVDIVGDYVRKSEFLNFEKQVNEKLTAVYHYKGTVPNYASLPTTGNTIGDTYNDNETGANYSWNGTLWDKLSETIDFSSIAMKSDIPIDYINNEAFEDLVKRVEILEKNHQEGET